MAEPAKQEDDDRADELDALLEEFRDADASMPRRKRGRGGVWVLVALILIFAGIWLGSRQAMRGPSEGATQGPPTRPTKAAIRPPKAAPFSGDVVADYIARCEKGLTEQEVRWIVEDFRIAGLEPGFGSLTGTVLGTLEQLRTAGVGEIGSLIASLEKAAVSLAQRQRVWYLNLLVDGLRLDPGQREIARQRVAAAFEAEEIEFRDRLKAYREARLPQGSAETLVPEQAVDRLLLPQSWLLPENMAPWELCELTDAQKRVTWLGRYLYLKDVAPDSLMYQEDLKWINFNSAGILDPLSDKAWDITDFPTSAAPDKVNAAGAIFPFVLGQSFYREGEEWAGPVDVQAMGCHPSQLKTSLLIGPQLAALLTEAFARDGQ